MIALRLDRRKPFLTVLSSHCRASIAIGLGELQVQSQRNQQFSSQGHHHDFANTRPC
jgi:hypothetical protein